MTRPPYQEYAWQLAANDSRRKQKGMAMLTVTRWLGFTRIRWYSAVQEYMDHVRLNFLHLPNSSFEVFLLAGSQGICEHGGLRLADAKGDWGVDPFNGPYPTTENLRPACTPFKHNYV